MCVSIIFLPAGNFIALVVFNYLQGIIQFTLLTKSFLIFFLILFFFIKKYILLRVFPSLAHSKLFEFFQLHHRLSLYGNVQWGAWQSHNFFKVKREGSVIQNATLSSLFK